jgi:hypothetical protein
MGGKSRKTGSVSKKLIDRIKNGTLNKPKPKTKSEGSGKSKKANPFGL